MMIHDWLYINKNQLYLLTDKKDIVMVEYSTEYEANKCLEELLSNGYLVIDNPQFVVSMDDVIDECFM